MRPSNASPSDSEPVGEYQSHRATPDRDAPWKRGSVQAAGRLGLNSLHHGLGERVLLWWGDLDRPDTPASEDPLDPLERARADRFRFEHDARRYRAAHALLRRLLGAACDLPASEVRWRIGEYGKPHLLGTDSLHFNMSHCGRHVAIALSEGSPVGIDVEAGARLDASATLELARRCFTGAEQATLHAAQGGLLRDMFLRGWTRKEACLKALGSGLSIEPNTFEAGLEPARTAVRIAAPAGVGTLEVDSVRLTPGVEGAVALLAVDCLHLAL